MKDAVNITRGDGKKDMRTTTETSYLYRATGIGAVREIESDGKVRNIVRFTWQ